MVDTFEEEEEIDLDEINRMIEQDNQEIAQLEKEIAEQLAPIRGQQMRRGGKTEYRDFSTYLYSGNSVS